MGLPVKYPQGAEKQLIKALTGREVPAGGLPMDVGALVNNVGTAYAVAQAIQFGRPLIERAVTVTGEGIKTPKNLMVRIGTPIQNLIDECGGFISGSADEFKVINGGPMMGIAVSDLQTPVIKGNFRDFGLSEGENCI